MLFRSLHQDQASKAIAEVIIAMGKALGLAIVGEGVDSEQTLGYLRRQGCQQVQGNFLAEPMPPADFLKWYDQYSQARSSQPLH